MVMADAIDEDCGTTTVEEEEVDVGADTDVVLELVDEEPPAAIAGPTSACAPAAGVVDSPHFAADALRVVPYIFQMSTLSGPEHCRQAA